MNSPTNMAARSGGASPIQKLYSPRQIGLAALIGAPAAAGWFIAYNERQLGRLRSSRRWFWSCMVALLLLIAVSISLPPNFPRTGLAAGYVAGFYVAAKQLHGAVFQRHLAAGGARGSWWRIVWVSLLFLTGSLALIVVSVLLLPPSFTDRFIPADQLP